MAGSMHLSPSFVNKAHDRRGSRHTVGCSEYWYVVQAYCPATLSCHCPGFWAVRWRGAVSFGGWEGQQFATSALL